MAFPFVSVVIVTRDRSDLFRRAFASVLDQNYRPIEIVLVDNASNAPLARPDAPDGVAVTLTRAARRFNASAARNVGIDHARGVYVNFLDDDDFFLPGKLARQVAALEADPGAAFCVMDHEIRDRRGTRRCGLERGDGLEAVLLHRPIHTNAFLIRASVLATERFDERLDKYTDLPVWFRLFENYRGVRAEGVGSVWNCDDRPDQITHASLASKLRDMERNRRNWKILCERFAHLIDRSPRLRRAYYGKQAALSLLTGRLFEAGRYARSAAGTRSAPARGEVG